MFRSRGENLRSVFILLFLNVAFFLLEHQDPAAYVRVFRFDWNAVLHGEVWRVVTWQFRQAGDGWLEALALFVTLLLLYMMGSALEEEWGTRHFLTLFAISTLTSAAVAAWLGIPLLGTYFIYYTLLFVYAAAFPQQTLYLFGAIPVRFGLIAMVSFAALVFGAFAGGLANIAALVGAASGFTYFLTQRVKPKPEASPQTGTNPPRVDSAAMHNGMRYAAMKKAIANSSIPDMERLLAQCDREKIAGVNVCPPPDYKPDNMDGYCIRCEGFAECSARYLRAKIAATAPAPTPVSDCGDTVAAL
jgi:membrane associated rhomboid family serine protease